MYIHGHRAISITARCLWQSTHILINRYQWKWFIPLDISRISTIWRHRDDVSSESSAKGNEESVTSSPQGKCFSLCMTNYRHIWPLRFYRSSSVLHRIFLFVYREFVQWLNKSGFPMKIWYQLSSRHLEKQSLKLKRCQKTSNNHRQFRFFF